MDFTIEKSLALEGFSCVCGIDEAGCGPLAGPVFAAAVVLGDDKIEGLNDSKKLSESKREMLYERIIMQAKDHCVASVDEREIDKINILQARLKAMRLAVFGLQIAPDFALIDGDRDPMLDISSRLIIKGDSLSASIAAASILAKVSRDRYMLKIAEKYPQYLFEKHKGYPTKLHYEMLEKHGVSPVHRVSFLRKRGLA